MSECFIKTTSASDVLMSEQLRNWISFRMNKVFTYQPMF